MPYCLPYQIASQMLPSPEELWNQAPSLPHHLAFQEEARTTIRRILTGEDTRLMIVMGPCSIHNSEAAYEYAIKLKKLSENISDSFYLVMRTYFEKPRTATGWKGLLYDPKLDGSHDIATGLLEARKLLCALAESQIPTATEFLDPSSPCYLADLISWGSIGARTVTSQIHRQIASSLTLPMGFKNSIDGNLDSAIKGVIAAQAPHTFLGINGQGRLSVVESQGNPHTHIVLRGGRGKPNYDSITVSSAMEQLRQAGLQERLMIDCSHDNCERDYQKQTTVFQAVIDQIYRGNSNIFGLILESHLEAGSQQFPERNSAAQHSLSLTDPCIDWPATEELLLAAQQKLTQSLAVGV